MYHTVEDQERNPDDYELTPMAFGTIEDECFDLLSKPRHTQTTIGLYLKKIKGERDDEKKDSKSREPCPGAKKRPDPNKLDPHLEHMVQVNKGFWVDKPTVTAPLVYKLREHYSVKLPKKDNRKGQGVFYRPYYLELDYLIKLGEAGLLYPDEEVSDSEEPIKPDMTQCIPLRKKKYKICDPCKTSDADKEKDPAKEVDESYDSLNLPFKKIPTGCQCDYYGDHNTPPKVWDNPFYDEVDMVRNHEMNKYLKPFKHELLNKNYLKSPSVVYKPASPGAKRTFPLFMLGNL